MYRIRLHGRGGQGIKTASRILGSALFAEGFEVQDAPRYGAERRGAPIFAYVRAAREPIQERGVIRRPDLVAVADDTLVPVAAAGVQAGLGARTVLLLVSAETPETWRERLRLAGPVLTLLPRSADPAEQRFLGVTCAGAAARLLGVIPRPALAAAVRQEVAEFGPRAVEASLERALAAFDGLAAHAGCVAEGAPPAAEPGEAADWVDLPFEPAERSAPDVRVPATSVQVKTGLWRTMRPVLDRERCHRCTWVCGTLCPDAAISVGAEGYPEIDYDACKGCLVCVAVCAPHALRAVPERDAAAAEARS
jgi:pyruvate ferredoxin oxidoreductase gamma subunit